MALYPLPAHAAGGRLCSILGISPRFYLRKYQRANLLEEGKWSRLAARLSASVILTKTTARRFVLLGAKVADAFRVPFEPFRVHRVLSWPTLVLPHPSGRCRIWNDPESTQRARRVFQAFTLRPITECKWEGCPQQREGGHETNFCKEHGHEFFARLFPSHPQQGVVPLKTRYRPYRIRGEKT